MEVYLDYAAATPMDSDILAVMQPYFSDKFYNPSSPYAPAVAVRREYEAAKADIAGVIGARPTEIVMTAGATESINLAFGARRGHVVTTNVEHQAVLSAAARNDHTLVSVDKYGRVKPEDIQAAITPDTWLVSVGIANSEIGSIQPIARIAEIVESERENRRLTGNDTPIYLHSDASQGAGQLDLHVSRLGVDMLTLNAAKIYGPKQVGILYKSRIVDLIPQIVGGGQELGLRSGTENVAGTVGMAAALKKADAKRRGEVSRLANLRNSLEKSLAAEFPDAVFSGHPKNRLASHLHISFPGIDAERLVFALEARGVYVATGSACAANKGTRSHVLVNIGLDERTCDGSLRITLGRDTNEDQIGYAKTCIIEEVNRERARTNSD